MRPVASSVALTRPSEGSPGTFSGGSHTWCVVRSEDNEPIRSPYQEFFVSRGCSVHRNRRNILQLGSADKPEWW